MKRRFFLRNIGVGGSSFLLPSPFTSKRAGLQIPDYTYGSISEFKEVINKDGKVRLRLVFSAADRQRLMSAKGWIKVKNCRLFDLKSYFFEPDDVFDMDRMTWQVNVNDSYHDVLLVVLENATPDSRIIIEGDSDSLDFELRNLVHDQQKSANVGAVKVDVNFLLDKEIGTLETSQVNIRETSDQFRFAIMADPQGGDPDEEGNEYTRMQIHNAFAENSIGLINRLDPKPAFTLILGDIVDAQGQKANFVRMHQYFRQLSTPILYEVGNHETRYRSVFTPGYNMEAFNNFFGAQKEINGLELMLYSFNIGQWHFIVWPDPLRANFWETHPHYFEWLENDLERHSDRPTVFFQHVPMHPIGINPLINYAESVVVKRTVLDILTRHGNVRYVFSGHVHIPVKASFKTATSYKGMNMINLPPAGYRPRGFGEADFFGGPSQGVLIVDVNGDQLRVAFRTVTEETFVYPEELPAFDEEKYPLWLNNKWELPAADRLMNGNFEEGLKYWHRRYVYMEDEQPSNICEVRRKSSETSYSSLYLYCRKRGYDAPGQDRLPQTINRICQAVEVPKGEIPVVSLKYMIDGKHSCMDGWCGAYVWIEGFNQSFKRMNLAYWLGSAYAGLGGKYNDSQTVPLGHFHLDQVSDVWHHFIANIEKDYRSVEAGFNASVIDKIVINLGVWTVNDGRTQSFGTYFNDLSLKSTFQTSSNVNGRSVQRVPDDKVWWMGKYTQPMHVAGEHRIVFETQELSREI